MTIPDKYAFWRWPAKIRSLTTELEHLKEEHARVLAGQSKLLEWVKVTHRLTSPAQGIRALLQNGKRLVPLLVLLLGMQATLAQPAPPILRSPLTTNSHFGPTPTEGQVPIWNAAAKKWSNNVPAGGSSTPHTWTNDNGTLKPIAFPTNILLRVNVPDDGIGTNFYFDSRVYRTNAASKLFTIRNGGSNALTIGPNGQLMAGRGNGTPFPGAVLYGIFDTALGETNQQEIFTLSGNSAVGYSGASDLIIDTNYGALILFANKEGGVKFTRFSVQAGAGDNPQNFNSFTMQALVDGATYMQMDPNFSLLTPTNYLFSSSIRITNTDTLLSLQNSNFPVLEVDGVGDLRLIKKIPYLWPSAQGAAGTTLTNNGSGALGWWPISAGSGPPGLTTNANQFLGVPLSIKDGAFLTNINVQSSLEVSNGWIYASGPVTNGTQLNLPHLTVSRSAVINAQGDVTNSSADSNWSLYPTNVWNDRQFGSQNLTNWSNIPTGAMANVVATDYLTNWANAISNLTQTKQFGSANLTNWSNIPTGAMANVVSTTFLTNWANAISNLAETKQLGSAVLTNLVGTVANNVTNVVSLSTTNATSKPLTNSYTAGVLTIFGVEQGSGQAITMNASNVVIANDWTQTASTTNVVGVSNWVNSVSNLVQTKQNGSAVLTNLVSTVANNVTNVVSLSTTNATSKPLTNAYANGVLTLFGIEQGSGLAVTMSSNIVVANDWAQTASTTNVVGVSNWVNSVSNLAQTKQFGSLTLTNLSGTGAITNLFTSSLSNATIKPLVVGVGTAAGATNTTGEIRGLEAGPNITLTPNGSNYVIASTGGGTVTFSDLLFTNEPSGRIHPVTWTNRLEMQRPITIGTNQNDTIIGASLNTNDFFVAYRSITNGEQYLPRFEFGAFSNGAISSIVGYIDDGFSGFTLHTMLDGGAPFGGEIRMLADARNIGGMVFAITSTNGFVPFSIIGSATKINNVGYVFPPVQGAAGTVLTNNGSGSLGWSAQLQPSSTTLTNLSGTGAITNLFSATLSNATIKPLVVGIGNAAGATNTTGEIRGLEAGANITLTPNGSNYVIASTGSGGVAFSDLVWTNDTVAIKPNAFPTNIMLRIDVPDDGVGTNYYWDARTYRANAASKLFALYNGGSNALTVGPFGGVFIGRNNATPVNLYAFNAMRDTAIGEPNSAFIQAKASQSTVGYFGTTLFGVNTNSSELTMRTFDGVNKQCIFAVTADNFTNSTLKLTDKIGSSERGVFLSPGIGLTYPTNYMFNTWYELTNTDTLLSLQNSNTPVFEIDGIGDLKLLKRVAYSWPVAQGGASTVLANDGSGNLSWSGAFQPGSTTLTNLAGTKAITNLFAPSLSNATIKPIVFGGVGNAAGMTNTTGQVYGLEAGAGTTLTPNGSNIVIATTVSGTGVSTNANQFGTQVTLTLKDGIFLTNIIAFPTGNGTAPALTVTNVPGIGTNSFQVLNTNGVPVIYGLTNNGITLVASNVNFLGPQTNTSSLNVLGGVTNWAAVETRGNATNAGWLAIAGGFTNIGGSLLTGSVTNGGRVDTAGGATNWIGAETKGTLYASSNLLVKAGQGTSNAWVGGRIFIDASTATTNHSGTAAYTNLFTYTVPGNTLTNTGDELEFYLSGQFKFATTTTNGFKAIYGTATIFDTGLITASNCPWAVTIRMTRTGNSSQRVESKVLWNVSGAVNSSGNGPLSCYATNMPFAQNNGITNIFVFQGESRIAAVITNDYRAITYTPGLN